MGRKLAFTEFDVIKAVSELEAGDKKINGTNLRLNIGVGSPKSLFETYTRLLAKGDIKHKDDLEKVQLEVQLEAQLEAMSVLEDKVQSLTSEITVLRKLINETLPCLNAVQEESMVHDSLHKKLKEFISEQELTSSEILSSGINVIQKYLDDQADDNQRKLDIRYGHRGS